jgi:adenosylcobinamide-GDP ribazoletransferase
MKKLLEDARICLALLTRLPVPMPKGEDGAPLDLHSNLARIGKAYRAAPLVGVVVGLTAAIAYFLGYSLPGAPIYLAAVLAVGVQLTISGASEEIGFAKLMALRPHPSADAGEADGHDEIAGVVAGTIASMVVVLLKIFLVAELAEPFRVGMALIAASAFGRAAQVQLMAFTTSDSATQPSKLDATTSMIVGAALGAGTLLLPNIDGGVFLTIGGFVKTIVGALIGIAIGAGMFFGFTKSRLHLDNINVKEALCLAIELGALFGIVAMMPFPGE